MRPVARVHCAFSPVSTTGYEISQLPSWGSSTYKQAPPSSGWFLERAVFLPLAAGGMITNGGRSCPSAPHWQRQNGSIPCIYVVWQSLVDRRKGVVGVVQAVQCSLQHGSCKLRGGFDPFVLDFDIHWTAHGPHWRMVCVPCK